MVTGSKYAKPRLLHIFSTLRVGGPQRRFASIANQIGRECTHIVHAMDGCYDALDLLTTDVECSRLEDKFKISPNGSRVLAYRKILKLIGPDTLLTYNWGAIEWAMANYIAVCRHIHFEDGFGPEEASRQFARRVWTRRVFLRGETQVIVPSNNLLAIAKNDWNLKGGKATYVPNGVDVARFNCPKSKEILREFGVPTKGHHIGTVTALRREKNIPRLLQAFASALSSKDTHLIIVGDGPERQTLLDQSGALNIPGQVHFVGHVDKPERVLAALDFYALSSDTEQMPISVLEAMAAGLPIVSTDVGDVRQMVSEQNGIFIKGSDCQALSASLSACFDSPELWEKIGNANRARALEKFSLAQMVTTYRGLYYGKSNS